MEDKFKKLQKFFPKNTEFQYGDGHSFYIPNKSGSPQAFIFDRDAFIRFLEAMDYEFEKAGIEGISPAGEIIDSIEAQLPADTSGFQATTDTFENIFSLNEVEKILAL